MNISSVCMDLFILTQLTVSYKLSTIQILFDLFLFSQNTHSYFSRTNFFSTRFFFLELNECLFKFIFVLKMLIYLLLIAVRI